MLAAARCEDAPVPPRPGHAPVMLRETLELLSPGVGATVVDGTVGAGGHAEALLEAIGPGGRLFGVDRDPVALGLARERLARFGDAFVPVRGDHTDLRDLLERHGGFAVEAIIGDWDGSPVGPESPEIVVTARLGA